MGGALRKKIVYICLLTVVINVILYFKVINNPESYEQYIGNTLVNLTNEINKNNTVKQEIQPIADEMTEIKIFFSTYNRENTGITNMQLIDSKGDEIYSVDIDNSKVKDNQYLTLEGVKINVDTEERYTMILSSTLQDGGITAWQDADGQLVCTLGYTNTFSRDNWFQVNIVFLLINIGFINLISYLKK